MQPHSPTSVSIPTPLPTPLPPHLRATLQSHLITSSAIPSILTSLQSACAATGWEEALRERVMEILREGEVGSKEELVGRIVGEVRGEVEGEGNGDVEGRVDGKGEGKGKGKEIKKTNIRIPNDGIKEGTRIVRDVLESCVQIQPEQPEKDFWA